MFRKKCVVIMYETRTTICSYYIMGRFVSYTTLFIAAKENLNNKLGDNFAITNVIKL